METVSAEIVREKLAKQRKEYKEVIDGLPIGAALKIHPSMWPRRESIYHYFLTRYKGQVSVRHLTDGYYYVVKIA